MSRHRTPDQYNSTNLERLRGLRSLLFTEIERELEGGGTVHPQEGIFQLKFPSIFGAEYKVTLFTLLLAPRSFRKEKQWTGSTLNEAVSRAEKDIKHWIQERKSNEH